MRPYAAVSLFVLLSCIAEVRAENPRPYREIHYVMGTLLDITLYHHDAQEARKLLDEAFSTAQRFDEILSNYKPESEISLLNQRAGRGRVTVSPELYYFLDVAKELWRQTDGAFDVTVGPLVRLWKKAQRRGSPPSPEALNSALALVGMGKVVFHSQLEVELERKGMSIDTGGIGKGYAVDKIAALFHRSGIRSALINFGQSSIYALGSPPEGAAWRLLLKFPDQEPLGVLEIQDQALSASDSFGRPFDIAGKRYAHLLEPQTGWPLARRIQAVALGPSAAAAEALGKYIILRRPKEKMAEWRDFQTLLRSDDGFIERSSNFPLQLLSDSK